MSDTGRNSFAVEASHNPVVDETHRGAKKVNAVNYLAKPPPPVDEYYYEEDSYAANEQTRDFQQNTQGSN